MTNPDSGVHASGSNLIFAGVSNLSNFAVFAACRHLKNQRKSSSPLCAYYDILITRMNARRLMKTVEYGVIFTFADWFVSKETKESVNIQCKWHYDART